MAVPLESRQPSMRNVPPGRFDDGRESGAWGRYRESLCIRLMLAQVPNLNFTPTVVWGIVSPQCGESPSPGHTSGGNGERALSWQDCWSHRRGLHEGCFLH